MTQRFLQFVFAAVFASIAIAGSPDDRAEQPSDTKKVQRPTLVKLTANQESSALKFAKQHHPELAELLTRLRRSSPTGFGRGIREVYSAAQRLERLAQRQPARREAELRKWKLDSEIRLLTARWAMSQDPELEQTIQRLLRERQEVRMARLKTEREKLAERLQQLDEQIGMSSDQMEADLAAEWKRLTRQATTATKNRKRPAKKSPKNRAQKLETEQGSKA